MLSSLRTRLWFSYALLVVVVIGGLAMGAALMIARDPGIYRQSAFEMRVADALISQRIVLGVYLDTARVERILTSELDNADLRVVILAADGKAVIDAGQGAGRALPTLEVTGVLGQNTLIDVSTYRDARRQPWLYTLRLFPNGSMLLVSMPRPTLQILALLRDEFLRPVVQVTGLALLLAVLLSLVMGGWIARPLQRMVQLAHATAQGSLANVPLEGPGELRQLGQSLNEMSQKVHDSQQSQRDFVANVSHELKTPLTSIQGFAQAILDGTVSTPQDVQQAAGVIYSESERMYRLVQELLSLARLEAGTADLEQVRLDLREVLQSLAAQFALRARTAGVDLTVETGESLPLLGDGDRLMQVFNNLLDNAFKFTPQGGRIRLQATTEPGKALVRVTDSGPGIDPAEQKRIFERFYQVDKARSGGGDRGVGLGLAIAAEIVRAHGGEISVESAPDGGSTFTVRLPLAAAENRA